MERNRYVFRASFCLRSACAGLALAQVLGCTSLPDSLAPATPQRPTFSSDTNTTAPGTTEVEAGVGWSDDLLAAPATLKYGAGKASEVFLGLAPVAFLGASDGKAGIGYTVLGLRHRLADEGEFPSFAIQSSLLFPTGDFGPGIDGPGVTASMIATKGLGRASVTGYYEVDLVGRADGGAGVTQGVALAGSRPVLGPFGAFAEVAGIFGPEASPVFTTFGGTCSASVSQVFDLAARIGLNGDALDWEVLAGLTINLGRLVSAW